MLYIASRKKKPGPLWARENKTNNQKKQAEHYKTRIWGENSQGRKDET